MVCTVSVYFRCWRDIWTSHVKEEVFLILFEFHSFFFDDVIENRNIINRHIPPQSWPRILLFADNLGPTFLSKFLKMSHERIQHIPCQKKVLRISTWQHQNTISFAFAPKNTRQQIISFLHSRQTIWASPPLLGNGPHYEIPILSLGCEKWVAQKRIDVVLFALEIIGRSSRCRRRLSAKTHDVVHKGDSSCQDPVRLEYYEE